MQLEIPCSFVSSIDQQAWASWTGMRMGGLLEGPKRIHCDRRGKVDRDDDHTLHIPV